jgi:hypothetical protein
MAVLLFNKRLQVDVMSFPLLSVTVIFTKSKLFNSIVEAESVTRKLSPDPFVSVVPDFLQEEKKLTNPMQAMLRNKTFFINDYF